MADEQRSALVGFLPAGNGESTETYVRDEDTLVHDLTSGSAVVV